MTFCKKFWVVMQRPTDCNTPVVVRRYDNELDAVKSAELFATASEGNVFYVLEAQRACVKSNVQWSDTVDAPF